MSRPTILPHCTGIRLTVGSYPLVLSLLARMGVGACISNMTFYFSDTQQ